jgi:MFS family permease
MTSRAVVALGIGQCVSWGVLYYAFGVLLVPVERDLGVPRWVVAGAFSLALLMSAALAPIVGRWADRGHGPMLMQAGGLAAAALLGVWTLVSGVATLYLAWAGLGLCMAATLYEPAFAVVGRALPDRQHRLRALATVTVFGGLASTIFLPFTAVLVEAWGWRAAVAVLASVLAVSTSLTSVVALRRRAPDRPLLAPSGAVAAASTALRPTLGAVLVVFSGASLASAAFTTTLVPAFVDRDLSPTTAAMLGGLMGLMQLPGRALLMRGSLAASPSQLLIGSLLLQAAGLAALVGARSVLPVAGGVAVFAAGAGLATLVRPHLVQTIFGMERAGHLNGRLARWQQLARAAGPVLAVGLAGRVGYGALFGLLATMFAALAVTSRSLPRSSCSTD